MQTMEMSTSNIQEFFRGSRIFITGVTGFLGQVLLEKLLRTCHDLDRIYLLIRPKKGKTENTRLDELFNDLFYESLKRECSDWKSKVVLVSGDLKQRGLGLNEQDRATLVCDVNVVFHLGATVRFDEKLQTAVAINVLATRDILELAKEMRQLESFVYVSTAYANCPRQHINEQFYPPPMKPDKLAQAMEVLPDNVLTVLMPKILGDWPNTYTFSKAVAEDVVRDFGKDLPVVVVRPPIVISTVREPVCGWNSNLYGPLGIAVGSGLGFLRTLHFDTKLVAELVPADLLINFIITAAWDVAVRQKLKTQPLQSAIENGRRVNDVEVMNYTSSDCNPLTWKRYMQYAKCGLEYPSLQAVWYHCIFITKYRLIYNLSIIFMHYLPALIVDALLRLLGKKPMMWNVYMKIHRLLDVLCYFMSNTWKFTSHNVQAVQSRMNAQDRQLFDCDITGLDWQLAVESSSKMVRIYIMHESPDTLETARKRYQRLKIAHYTLVCALSFLLLGLVAWKIVNMIM